VSRIICSVCNRLQDISYKDRKYVLRPDMFVCSLECVRDWIGWHSQRVPKLPSDAREYGAEWIKDEAKPVFKSDFEKLAYDYLRNLGGGHSVLYEAYAFPVGDRKHFIPDFFLPDVGVFIEVKGIWWTAQKKKYKEFFEQYVGVQLLMFNWLLRKELLTEEKECEWL